MEKTRALFLTTTLIFFAGIGGLAADEVYADPRAGFSLPTPPGWRLTQEQGYARFSRDGVEASVFAVAAPGNDLAVTTAALQLLIDESLGQDFADEPMQATPVPLPSGTWTQRLYQREDRLIAAISLEREGLTTVLVSEATQAEFMQHVNAALNAMLVSIAFADKESEPDELSHLRREVTFSSGSAVLAGTVTIPEGEGPFPAVILISGSGAQDRDGWNPALPNYRPMRWIADHFALHGIATLRFDERGFAQSGGDHLIATTADFADDNEAALEFLREFAEIDRQRIGFLGHSEGGVIAAMVAARNPEVAFVINMAGSSLPYSDIVVQQVVRIAEASGSSPDEVARMRELQIRVMGYATAGDWDEVRDIVREITLEQIAQLPESQIAQIGDPEVLANRQADADIAALQTPWMQFFMSHDPRQDWEQITVPVLTLYGALDTQVDVSQNRPPLEAALERAGNRDVTVTVIETANHLFQEARTGGPDEYVTLGPGFHPEFLSVVTEWISERFVR